MCSTRTPNPVIDGPGGRVCGGELEALRLCLCALLDDPPQQGRGIGGQLMQPILSRADADGLPCYLETMKPRNVPFYRKHGFEVLVEADLPGGGVHFWTMRRPPRG